MDINTFQSFLESQRGGFETFLKGCNGLNREQMRLALSTHSSKMTFALATELPIIGAASHSSPFGSGRRSGTRSVTSPFKSPHFYKDQKLPTSTSFKSVDAFNDLVSSSMPNASSTNTPKSKRREDLEPSSTNSSYGSSRHLSGGVRSSLRGGTIGGAGLIFKPATPTSKKYALDNDSSAGSAPLSDDSYTNSRSSHKRTSSTKVAKPAKSCHTPKSPFERAARAAERKKPYSDSESTSDFEIPLRRPTLRKVSSARSRKGRVAPKKGADSMMDVDSGGDVVYSEELEKPSKKQKTISNGDAAQRTAAQIDLTL